ncbi:Neutral ceramidase [Pleurotus pulmonarius]
MPSLYHHVLPLAFDGYWDILASLPDTMSKLVWSLTKGLLVSNALFASLGYVDGQQGVAAQYLLGLGVGDITGPVVETNLMGYASLAQVGTGLHMRQRSRAFIVADAARPADRVVFINADIAMGDSGVRRSIVSQLSSQFPGVYTNDNIAFVGTHQHSGVGGFLENLLPQITSLGYVKQSADAIVAGTVRAVQRAHASLAPGKLSLGNTTVLDANINRSPSAYLANPAEERARYEFDQDKDMTLLRFDDANGNPRGFLNFFAVHGTSIYENNTLISTDNKGMAAFLYESSVEPTAMPGNTTFVAGFTQSNVGDTSPNTLGAFCESPGEAFDGQPCDFETSTCGGTAQACHGRGPGFRTSDFESNRMIGDAQFQGAQRLMSGTLAPVHGAVKSVHTYLNMATHSFQLPNGSTVNTCPAALGFSFAGGTTDGPGAFDFVQGDNSTSQNPFWQIVKGAITPLPSAEQKACQAPKPILLNTGAASTPYAWSPSTVSIQMLRVGNFVILVMPGELTTMAGRRMREALRAKLISSGVIGSDAYVVVAGPANTYAHYVTTKEEYSIQRYEGASTIFGQYTLDAYIDKYGSLVSFLADNASAGAVPPSDPAPPDLSGKAISLQTAVVFDAAPIGKRFGQVLTNVNTTPYHAGDAVRVQFVGANPRNNLRLESTFLTVEQQVNGQWLAVRSDSHPSTTFKWTRTSTVLGTSTVDVTWTIESGTPAGTYRISYFGDSKPLIGSISSFSGISGTFTVA